MAARKHPSNPLVWPKEACLEALHRWVAEHGRTPSSMRDWRRASYTHPTARTCVRHFGSWSAFIREGGYEPRRSGSAGGHPASECVVSENGTYVYWTRERIADWLLDFLLREGRWPTSPELRRATTDNRPSFDAVRRAYGTYSDAKRAAGWRSECEACGTAMPTARASQKFCSLRCRRAGKAPLVVAEEKCVGCGTDLENCVIGCKTCWDRHRHKQRRTASAGRLAAVEAASDTRGARSGGDFASTPTDGEANQPAVKEAA